MHLDLVLSICSIRKHSFHGMREVHPRLPDGIGFLQRACACLTYIEFSIYRTEVPEWDFLEEAD